MFAFLGDIGSRRNSRITHGRAASRPVQAYRTKAGLHSLLNDIARNAPGDRTARVTPDHRGNGGAALLQVRVGLSVGPQERNRGGAPRDVLQRRGLLEPIRQIWVHRPYVGPRPTDDDPLVDHFCNRPRVPAALAGRSVGEADHGRVNARSETGPFATDIGRGKRTD